MAVAAEREGRAAGTAAERERVAHVRPYRFAVDEFARMGEAGIFTEDDRVELIDGAVLEMTPIGPPHAGIVGRLTELLVTRLAGRAYVSVQNPIRLDRHTEPQPDLVVARRRQSGYTDRHPDADDVLLVVEVADSSLRHDREQKAPRYGKAGIPETWLVDLAAGTVTVYSDPGPDGYARAQVRRRGDGLRSALRRAAGGEDRDAAGEGDRGAADGGPTLDVRIDEIFG